MSATAYGPNTSAFAQKKLISIGSNVTFSFTTKNTRA